MLNIKATLNGEDSKNFNIQAERYSYQHLKQALREQFVFSSGEDFEVFNSDNLEVENNALVSNRTNELRLAILNKNHVPDTGDAYMGNEKGKPKFMFFSLSL